MQVNISLFFKVPLILTVKYLFEVFSGRPIVGKQLIANQLTSCFFDVLVNMNLTVRQDEPDRSRSRMFVFVVFVTCDWSRERRGSGVTSYSDVCTVKITRGTQLISIPYWPWEPRLKHVISVLWWHTLPLHPDVYYRPNRTPLYSINYRDRSC